MGVFKRAVNDAPEAGLVVKRVISLGLLGAALVAVAQIVVYARNQSDRADGWREQYFDLLDAVNHAQQCTADAPEGGGCT